MIRGTMALMDRALRVDSRSVRGHLIRFLFVGLIVWCLVVTQLQAMLISAAGLEFVRSMITIALFLITLGGVSLFATAITEEKEEQTLGLLRMAGVGPASLLLGKGVTRILIALLILAAQFPFMLLGITLGGVLIHQVWAAYVAICAYLIMIGNAGLFVSVIFRTSRMASFTMTLALLVYFFGPWLLQMVLASAIAVGNVDPTGAFAANADRILQKLSAANIFVRSGVIFSSGFSEPLISFQVVFHTISAGVFFLLFWLSFACFNHQARGGEAERPLFGRRTGKPHWIAVPRPWPNALVWKDFFFAGGGWTLMVAKFILYGLIILGVVIFVEAVSPNPSLSWDREVLGDIAIWVSLVLLFAELCIYSSRIFRDEIRHRTLSSIAMLPTSIPALVYSKWLGCLLATVPALTYFFAGVFLSPEDFFFVLEEFADEPGFYYLLMQFVVGFHLCTLLSMYIKYGSVAVTVALLFVGNILTVMTVQMLTWGTSDGEAFFVLGCMASMALTAILHAGVILRVGVMAQR